MGRPENMDPMGEEAAECQDSCQRCSIVVITENDCSEIRERADLTISHTTYARRGLYRYPNPFHALSVMTIVISHNGKSGIVKATLRRRTEPNRQPVFGKAFLGNNEGLSVDLIDVSKVL